MHARIIYEYVEHRRRQNSALNNSTGLLFMENVGFIVPNLLFYIHPPHSSVSTRNGVEGGGSGEKYLLTPKCVQSVQTLAAKARAAPEIN